MTLIQGVILDRDGVINPEGKWVNKVEDFELSEGVGEAIAQLCTMGIMVFVATNQGGVAFGHLTEDEAYNINVKMEDEVRAKGGFISYVNACYTHPEGTVNAYRVEGDPRRKPGTGMLSEILVMFNLDPAATVMVGNTDTDIIPAKALGLVTYFVGDAGEDNGNADFWAEDLASVVEHIVFFDESRVISRTGGD